MGKFIFIVGGARSGKSRYAQELAKREGRKVLFIATSLPLDNEMKRRVAMHKKSRPRHWKVVEGIGDIKSVLIKLKERFDVIIIDCLGIFISNLLIDSRKEKEIEREIKSICRTLSRTKVVTIVVSNEVGSGVVPENYLARKFRDLLGMSNQLMSHYADIVYIMQAGVPVKIKPLTTA